MIEYYIPTQHSQTELVEKRSRFIGQVWRVSSEEEARARIEETKKKHYDARHNCWCYRLREGGVERYSDDGEPQGTAGQPMLNVFQRENVNDVVCVVTRYFGGILLGAGGLDVYKRQVQYDDRLLGRAGCHLGGARGHLLYPATAVYQGVHRPRRIFHPDLFWGGVPEGPIQMCIRDSSVGLLLDHGSEVGVHGLGQIEAKVVLHDIGRASLTGLGVDTDDWFILPAHIGWVDGQVRDLPVVGVGLLHILGTLVDGILVAAGERGKYQFAHIGLPVAYRHLGRCV